MPNGLIDDTSLRTHPEGLALALTLPWYRSLWLSSVSTLRLTVDGEVIPAGELSLELGGVRYALADLPAQSDTLWYLQEHPLLIAPRDTPVSLGSGTRFNSSGNCGCPTCRSRRDRTAVPACTCRTS